MCAFFDFFYEAGWLDSQINPPLTLESKVGGLGPPKYGNQMEQQNQDRKRDGNEGDLVGSISPQY